MKKILMALMFCIVFISFASSAQITNVNINNGLQLYTSQFDAIKYNTSYEMHVHVSNISTGLQVPNNLVSCYLHLYNSSGEHIFERNTPLSKDVNGWDHEVIIEAGNFTEADKTNNYYVWCNSTDLGGEAKGFYEITANGKPTPSGLVIVAFGFLLVIILIFMVVYLIKIIGLLIEINVDLLDVAYIWGLFFGLLGVYQLAEIYLGNLAILNWFSFFVSMPFGIAMVLIPAFAFLISMIMSGTKQKKKEQEW